VTRLRAGSQFDSRQDILLFTASRSAMGPTQPSVQWDPPSLLYNGTHRAFCTMGPTQPYLQWGLPSLLYNGTHPAVCTMGPTQPSVQWDPHSLLYNGIHTAFCTIGSTQPSVQWDPHSLLYNWIHTAFCTMGPTHPSVQWIRLALAKGINRPRRHADYSLPCSGEVTNAQTHKHTHRQQRDIISLFYLFK
jgi:hypothetical protein